MKRRRCMFRNGHGCQEKWDIFVMLLAVYNSFTIPLQVMFHPHSMDHPMYILVDVIINIVFICDMLVNFRTTFIDEESGEEVTDLKEIAVNYLKSRFKIDVIGVLPWDDIARICIACGSSHSVNWIILIKMIRVLKVYDVISSLKVKEETKVAVQLVKILYLFVLYLHCHACAWYYIVEQDEHWYPPIELWHEHTEFYEGDGVFKYFNCLLHALLIFGGKDIGPVTTFQIVWCCSWIFAGAMLEALLFGKFADLAMEMNKKENLQEEKENLVNSAIKSMAIPEKLELKIEGFLAYTQNYFDFQHEFKLFYKIIPPSIKDQVIYHIFSETLKEHSSIELGSLLIDKLSQRLKVHTYSPEEEITVQGHDGDSLFVIAKGECLVVVRDHLSIDEPVRILKQGNIFGEVALIQNCKRTATVKTNNFSLVASLNKKDFKELSYQYKGFVPKLKQKMKSYDDNLKRFLISIVKIIPFMNDLPIEVEEMIACHLNQIFYNKDDIIFHQGDKIDQIRIISNGEVELLYNVDEQETRIHTLIQGACISGYQIHRDHNQVFTARALSNTTVHYITSYDLVLLKKTIPIVKERIESCLKYMNNTKNQSIGFCYFRDKSK